MALSLAATTPASALDGTPEVAASATRITGPLANGTPSPPAPKPVLPPFKATSTVVRRIDVVESPPMAGLPPVTGTITQTVHLVEDPQLPDPPPPLPPVSADDPRVLARLAEMSGKYRKIQILFLSATVYDHSRSLLRCYPNGNAEKKITVWSNLDFNHFCGFSNFEVKAADGGVRHYALIMGIGNEDTQKRAAFLAKHNVEYDLPQIPELPDDKPAYVIEDAAPDAGAAQLIADLHDLYQVEGPRMALAYAERTKAEAERRAFLLAHPPVPEDVTVLFWERTQPAKPARPALTEGGDP